MDPDVPPGMGGFLPGMLGDLLRLLRTDSPVQWDLATQLSQTIAAEGDSGGNVEPRDRIRLEELARLAELHVADITGMSTTASGHPVTVRAVTRGEWAQRSLEAWKDLFVRIAAALAPRATPDVVAADEDPFAGEEEGRDMAAFFGQWAHAIAPAMIGMQIGSIVGHLAQRALGQYELPLPGRFGEEIFVIPANRRALAEDWSLPSDDVELWLSVRDLTTHSVLSRPHVQARLESLLVEHARGVRPDPAALEAKMGDVSPADLGDMGSLARLFGDPSAFGELLDSPELRAVRDQLAALAAVIVGYAEWVTDAVAARAIGAAVPVHEAMRRRRVERSEDERAADALFGLSLDQDAYDRGAAFIRGVLDRGGENELARLWVVEHNLPTPAEVDAPGLWIERINLPPLEETGPAS